MPVLFALSRRIRYLIRNAIPINFKKQPPFGHVIHYSFNTGSQVFGLFAVHRIIRPEVKSAIN